MPDSLNPAPVLARAHAPAPLHTLHTFRHPPETFRLRLTRVEDRENFRCASEAEALLLEPQTATQLAASFAALFRPVEDLIEPQDCYFF